MKRSTRITWDQLKVGVVILAALLILAGAVYKLGQAANLFTKRYELVALVKNANGLSPGGAVLVAGQLAGTIRSIDFLPVSADTMHHLKLVMQLDKDLQPQVRGDSKARLRTQGLLGDQVIDISVGTPRYAPLRDGDTVPVEPSLDYQEVIARASAAVGDVVTLTHDLREITAGIVRGEGTMGQLLTNRTLYDQMTTTMANANSLLSQLQNPNGTFGRLMNDPTLYTRLNESLTAMDSLVLALNNSHGSLGRMMRDTTLYSNLSHMAASGDSLMTMIASGQGMLGKLASDDQLYDRVNKLVTDISALVADVRAHPNKYTKGMVKVF